MRPAVLAGFVLAVLPAAAAAQNGPYVAVVTDSEARLRAGPSDQFPETGTLTRGAPVVVDHDEPNGWVAVAAPQGQVSWVPTQFIDGYDPGRPTPQRVVVSSEGEVTLAAGQAGLHQPLDIRRVKVPNGTILTVTGPKATHAGKTWYPVTPPAEDFRYLPKSAVRFESAKNTSFVVRETVPVLPAAGPAGGPTPAGSATSPAGGVTPAGSPQPAPKPAVNHPLWAQAEAAERDGKFDEAERLFFQLARVMNEPGGDHDVANLCYTRIHSLREKRRPAGGSSAAFPPPPAGARLPDPAPSVAAARDSRPTLLPPTRDDRPADRTAAPTAGPAGPARPAFDPKDDRPQWTGPGVLVRSSLALDGRRTYALESAPGVVRAYVVPAPGMDLERYVNRKVDVYGSGYTRKGLSAAYVVATQVENQ